MRHAAGGPVIQLTGTVPHSSQSYRDEWALRYDRGRTRLEPRRAMTSGFTKRSRFTSSALSADNAGGSGIHSERPTWNGADNDLPRPLIAKNAMNGAQVLTESRFRPDDRATRLFGSS